MQTCLTVLSLPVADSVPVVGQPTEIESLESAAQALNSQISQGQKSLAAAYWELGDTLNQLRPLYLHGEWESHLARLGIEQTRAKRAIWFRNTYKTLSKAEKVESPTKAYADRPRKQLQRRKAAGDSVRHQPETVGERSMPVSDGEPEAGESTPVFDGGRKIPIATQPENVSDEEFLIFSSFVKACNGLGRAVQIFDACCSMYKEVAVNE